MNHFKLVSAIIVALCVTGLEAKRETVGVPQPQALPQGIRPVKLQKGKNYAVVPQRFEKALGAIVHDSNCSESSLGIVDEALEFAPWREKSTKWLDEATKEYARRCLTPDYIRDKVNSAMSSFGAMEVPQLMDHQFFVDYESEIPEKHSKQIMHGNIFDGQYSKALAKAVIRDLKEDFGKLKNQRDVRDYLKERLFEPCFVFNFNQANREVLKPLLRARFSIEGYVEIISSLDESAREQIFRSGFCQQFFPQSLQETFSGLVLRDLKSASA